MALVQANKEDAFNVMVLTLAITLVVILCSILVLWLLTKDAYLDSYFTLEAFFDVQNTAASTSLATLAFAQSLNGLAPILLIVIIDNLSRIMIVSFIIAAVIDFLNYANVEGIINDMKSKMLKRHIILCGYNNISERLIRKLKEEKTPYVVIESDREKELELNENKILAIFGDFARAEVLKKAGIERARSIVLTSDNDADNIVCVITARRLNPKIKVLSRISEESIRKKLYIVGSDMAVIPEHLAGVEMGNYLSRVAG